MPLPSLNDTEAVSSYVHQLLGDVDAETKRTIATDLKEEYFREAHGTNRLNTIALPIMLQFLKTTPPSFVRTSPEHQTRHTLMLLITRIPHSETMKPLVPELFNLNIYLIRNDNEDIGTLCVRAIVDLYRTFRVVLDPYIQPFTALCLEIYASVPARIAKTFKFTEEPAASPPPPVSTSSTEPLEESPPPLYPAFDSYKVLMEIPMATVLFSNPEFAPNHYQQNVQQFVPATVALVQLQVEPQRRAHEEKAKMNHHWIGVAPGIDRSVRGAYTDFITSQMKAMAYLAFIWRQLTDTFNPAEHTEFLANNVIRLLQDCPAEATASRKELLVAMRHIMSAEKLRNAFVPHLDTLLDEKLVLGTSVSSYDNLKPLAYTTTGDFIYHIRDQLTVEQTARVIHVYSINLHSHSIVISFQTMSMKLISNLIDTVVNKFPKEDAIRVLSGLLETTVDKLEMLHRVHKDVVNMNDATKSNAPTPVVIQVEKLKPTDHFSFVNESPDTVIKDARVLFWTLLHAYKMILQGLRSLDESQPNAEIMGRFFEGGIRCLVLFERYAAAPPQEKELMENFASVFNELKAHVFQEVWTLKFPFFMKRLLRHPNIMTLPQILLASEQVSRQLVSIMLRHLADELDKLGYLSSQEAAAAVRMWKMCFMAATLLPEQNELALVPHIPRLIVDSFPLAAKSPEPSYYYMLLRALFRAIGGHKFDHLYKEVLPLLSEMLENLNRLLVSVEPKSRDLIAELCLTVPVKLTHLLPYLGHLMKPLVYALRAGPDLVNQGLRTLELCIDNLTPEFLDPTLAPVLRDLMGGLHDILKPGAGAHISAHTTIRILGKLGGRNRKLQQEPHLLGYKVYAEEEMNVLLSFDGRAESVDISGMCTLATKTIRHANTVYRSSAFEVLKAAFKVLMGAQAGKNGDDKESESVYKTIVTGILDAVHMPELSVQAHAYAREISRQVFTTDFVKNLPSSFSRRTALAPLVGVHIDALTRSLIVHDNEIEKAKGLMTTIVEDLFELVQTKSIPEDQKVNIEVALHTLASHAVGLCFEETAIGKMAGYHGVMIFLGAAPNNSPRYIEDRQIEYVRALLSIIKDTPPDTLRNIEAIAKALPDVIRRVVPPLEPPPPPPQPTPSEGTSEQKDVEMQSAQSEEGQSTSQTPQTSQTQQTTPPTQAAPAPLAPSSSTTRLAPALLVSKPSDKNRIPQLVHTFVAELSNPNALVRSTSQVCLQLLADLTHTSLHGLIYPFRERLLHHIYTKPLRALPLATQIGHVEGVTYALNLTPPIPTVTDELWRLLHESLGIADADDQHLNPPRGSAQVQRHSTIMVTKLRVACIKLLTSAMPITDFFNQGNMRTRVISVYFKSLYLTSPEVKDAANEGLKLVLFHQSRLPRDLLHTGLKPILVNLGDSKRLTIANLDGLARLLDLLTNHFKVEIGTKLIDHYKYIISQPQMLQEAARGPLADNDELTKAVKLADIFHRLPYPGAVTFLDEFTKCIVSTETQMNSATPTPFTKPLSAFFNKYPVEAVNYLFVNLREPAHVRTIRNVLNANDAPAFRAELLKQAERLLFICFREDAPDRSLVTPGLLLCSDLAALDPEWFSGQNEMLAALLRIWREELKRHQNNGFLNMVVQIRNPMILIDLFQRCLEHQFNIDILFGLVPLYTTKIAIDVPELTRFLHTTVLDKLDANQKRDVLRRYLEWFSESPPPLDNIIAFARAIISPMLVLTYSQKQAADPPVDDFLNAEMIQLLHTQVWSRTTQLTSLVEGAPIDLLTIEVMHMSGLIIQYCPDLLEDAKKDILRFGWLCVNSEDIVVKQTSNVLLARYYDAYDLPQKLALRVWAGVLRPQTHQDGRHLIRQAVDIMAPALAKRMTSESAANSWAAVARRSIVDDGHAITQVIGTYRMIMRHSDIFFPHRHLFVPHMITTMPKLGMSPSSPLEGRLVSLDIAEHILRWERQRAKLQETPADDSSMAIDSNALWTLPMQQREACVSYLIKIIVTAGADLASKGTIVIRSLRAMRELLHFPGIDEVTVKTGFFDRALVQGEISEESIANVANSVRLLNVYVEEKPSDWFVDNISQLRQWLEKPLASHDPTLHEYTSPILERIVNALPPLAEDEDEGDVYEFTLFLHEQIEQGLRGTTHLTLALNLLTYLAKKTSSVVESFAMGLMKVFTKQCRDHQAAIQSKGSTEPSSRLLKNVLEICRIQVPVSSEARKALINGMILLVDKSTDAALCRLIMTICREWVFVRRDGVPSMKEKANVLQKMTSFETKRDESLFTDFLDLIYNIYQEPTLHRTDLTTRLEPAFLIGLRHRDPILRSKFAVLFDESLPRTLASRLQYVLGSQSWEYLADHNWIAQAVDLLMGAVNENDILTSTGSDIMSDEPNQPSVVTVGQLIRPIRQLLYIDVEPAHQLWVSIFSAVWRVLSRKEQTDVARSLIILLGKEYHSKQQFLPRNVIQSLLAGAHACHPPLALPPYVVKYLGKTFNAWHTALEILQDSLDHVREDEGVRDSTLDALAELYAELSEEDMYYGLWRRRALYPETSIALSFEQSGLWPQAQSMYESAQMRARQGGIPFSESEYCLWEDHWILSSQKLQQWDVLLELANHEGNHDLALECLWRLHDWNVDREAVERELQAISDIATPRRRVFEALSTLIRSSSSGAESRQEFGRYLEDAMQLSLRKWVSLPRIVSMAHVPLLQHFQQIVELQEAAQIFNALSSTSAPNLEKRSTELKVVLQAWRERLPNLWDDVSVWSDLVAWRTHVFNAINKSFLPLIPQVAPPGTTNAASTAGYRGYHETAWIINRFAHIARKHQLLEVCHNSLQKIYTLPNIEISEAFLKLREQARCHYQVPSELTTGLEVINNTNLMYFSGAQKAEFYTLKGMFIAKLGPKEEANAAFAQAVQTDLSMPKSWAEWGRWSDRMFKENPSDMDLAGNAVSCYLQAAGLYRNAKSRPLLLRVLWFLTLDDAENPVVSRTFESYKPHEASLWYWITLIPQLLLSLSHREARHARNLLMLLAKHFPQALFYHLRTTREDFAPTRAVEKARAKAAADAALAQSVGQAGAANATIENGTPVNSSVAVNGSTTGTEPQTPQSSNPPNTPALPHPPPENRTAQHPWEFVEEIVGILRTAFPLLVPTLEMMAEQIGARFKPTQEEEIYRFLCVLLGEGVQQAMLRSQTPGDDGSVPDVCLNNITRLAASLPDNTRTAFEEDLVKTKLTMQQYVERLQMWRDRYEKQLDQRPHQQPLELLSHWLVEFHHSKYDDVEVPGQYLEHRDSAQHFVRVARFYSAFQVVRGNGICFRRFIMVGHDGTKHPFAVQLPAPRTSRREEHMMQLFRIFNAVLARRKESRKRNLTFHLPWAIPLSPTLRLFENDRSYLTLQDIYEQHCVSVGISKEEPLLAYSAKMKALLEGNRTYTTAEMTSLKMELQEEISAKLVPKTILSTHMARTMSGPMELWLMRKQFTLQIASASFMSYVTCGGNRIPSRFHLSRSTGLIYNSDLVSLTASHTPLQVHLEAVHFRLTPNLQHFITPNGMEGLLVAGIMALGRCLTEPDYDLDQQLGLFIREEIYNWLRQHPRFPPVGDILFRSHVQNNIDAFVKRAELLACKFERENSHPNTNVTAGQAVTDLISQATNPQNLSRMPEQWLAAF